MVEHRFLTGRRFVRGAAWALTGLFVFFLYLPIAIMIPSSLSSTDYLTFPPSNLSLRWYAEAVSRPEWTSSAWLSLRLAVAVGVLSALGGLSLALYHLRVRRIGTKLRLFLMLPVLVPEIVLASGLFALELRFRVLGWLLLLVGAQVAVALPYAVSFLIAGVNAIDPELWPASSTLGAAWPWTVRKVILPILLPTVLVTAVFAFQIGWDEVTFAALVGPSDVPTLPVRMYLYLFVQVTPVIAAISTLLLAFSALVGGVALAIHMGRSHRLRRAK